MKRQEEMSDGVDGVTVENPKSDGDSITDCLLRILFIYLFVDEYHAARGPCGTVSPRS